MVLQKLRSRLQGFGSKAPTAALESVLQRATNAATIEVPEDAVLAIVQASHNTDDRRLIMLHLHGCLAADAASQWRRVYSGIAVTEALLERGSPDVISEVAEGVHCDLVQRLSFLEAYEYSYDMRVQEMIRRRAQDLRAAWIERQLALVAPEVEHNSDTDDSGDERPKRPEPPKAARGGAASLLDDSTTDGESIGPVDPSPRPNSESPSSETARKHQGQAAAGPDLLGDGAETATAVAASPAAPAPAASVDLLGGEAPEVAPAPPSPPAAGLDLLLGDAGAAPSAASASAAPPAAAPPPPPPPPAPAPAAVAPAPAPTEPAPAAPAGGMDWLQMAKAHGLYESSAPGAGDLLGTSVGPAPPRKADLLDF